jgi:hypothetical protein
LDTVLFQQSQFLRYTYDATQTQAPDPSLIGSGSGGDDGQFLKSMTCIGDENLKTGMYALETVDLFNLLCIPPDVRGDNDTDPLIYQYATALCANRRAVLLVDPPNSWLNEYKQGNISIIDPSSIGIVGDEARNAAVYFPRVIKEDLLMNNQPSSFPACGIIAGIIASTDFQRGVWKAPAGLNAGINGIVSLEAKLSDPENGVLNPLGINCLRQFPVIGPVVWGDRTLRGADILEDDYKYLSVRRLALFIEESLYRGTKWAVFEPNDENLWASLRLSVGAFMSNLSRQGAFYGFKVTCDATTTTQNDINLGIVNVLVQFAPVKPAEFVVLSIQQAAGQTS